MKEDKEIGALQSVFPCSESKILDHMIPMKDFDYSITEISKISGIGFKTTLEIIHKMESQEVFKHIRDVGRSKMYQFDDKSQQGKSIEKMAFEIAKRRIYKTIGQQKEEKIKK